MTFINYQDWNPPKLTKSEETDLARSILSIGRSLYVEQFSRALAGVPDNEGKVSHAKRFAVWVIIVLITKPLLAFLPAKGIVPAILVPLIVVLSFLLGHNAWVEFKFKRWVDRLLVEYGQQPAPLKTKD